MVMIPSNMMPLGTEAPSFTLFDTVSGTEVSLQALQSKTATVIMFICNHCPFVKHIEKGLAQIAKDYQPKGISFIAISANDPINYPEDAPDNMTEFAEENDFTFPYLFDETQAVAKAYDAACTPDFFIFDADMKCVYRGQFDDARPGKDEPVTGADIRAALDAILTNKPINPKQKPSMGCNIKWK